MEEAADSPDVYVFAVDRGCGIDLTKPFEEQSDDAQYVIDTYYDLMNDELKLVFISRRP